MALISTDTMRFPRLHDTFDRNEEQFFRYFTGQGSTILDTGFIEPSLLLYIFTWNLYDFDFFEFTDELTVNCFKNAYS